MTLKKIVCWSTLLLLCVQAYSQDPLRKHSIGLYQTWTDYNVNILNGKLTAFDSSLSHSYRIAYQRRLSSSWMLNTGINNGFILNQSIQESFVDKAFTIGGDIAVMFKLNNGRLLKENPRIAPYLTFGYRTDYVNSLKKVDESPWLFHNQYGLGFNVKLTERTHLQLQTNLDQKLKGDFNTHMQYRFGLTQSLGKYDVPSKVPSKDKQLDSDRDGIVDSKDKCPGIFGIKEQGGCPDTLDYYAKKIKSDSLALLTSTQQSLIESLQLENAKMRAGLLPKDNSQEKINELNSKIALLEYNAKSRENQPRVDTVFVTTIEYKVKNANSDSLVMLVREKKRLEKELLAREILNETERMKLEKEREREEREKLAALNKYNREKSERDRILEQQRLEQEGRQTELDELTRLAKERLALDEYNKKKAERDRLARLEKERVTNTNTIPVRTNTSIPADKNYYVITISSPNLSTAENWLAKMSRDFSDARILPQPNGYYRVGVYAARDRILALEILEKVKQFGYNPAWLSVE